MDDALQTTVVQTRRRAAQPPGSSCFSPRLQRAQQFVFKAGMTICVDALIGAAGGKECVKLEEQILVIERYELPSTAAGFNAE